MVERPVLIYDGDCGFCTRSARLVEHLPTRARLSPWQQEGLAALGVTEARARHEVLWVSLSGRVFGGAAAVAELFKHCGGLWRPVGLALSAPVVRTIAARVYSFVSANRHRLPGETPACQLPADRRPGAGGPN